MRSRPARGQLIVSAKDAFCVRSVHDMGIMGEALKH